MRERALFAHPRLVSAMTHVEAVNFYADLAGWLADQPPLNGEQKTVLNESPGGDPRLMKGGKEKPNYRAPKGKR